MHFEAVVKRDAAFAPAYLGLGEAYDALGSLQVGARPASDMRPKAVAAVQRALQLDPELTSGHAALGGLKQADWQWAEAEADYRRALEFNPSLNRAHGGLGWLLVYRGRVLEGISSSRRARALDPLSIESGVMLGVALLNARRYDEAIRELRMLLELHLAETDALGILGRSLLEAGQKEEAARVLERAVSLSNRNAWYLGMLAHAHARGDRGADARRIVAELKRMRAVQYVTPGAFVYAYMGLGDHSAALAALEQAYAERVNIMRFLKVNPIFDPLRADPRFVHLVRRVGLD